MEITQIRELIRKEMGAVDRCIERRLQSGVVLINQLAAYIIHSGGKRLRPALVLLSSLASGYRGVQHYELAAIIEFIHTATLLHDDVVDGSSLRRGRETANEIWGNEASVLVGDFLYSRAFQMMVELGQMPIMEIMADATNTIAEGEVMQLLNCHDPEVSEERYLETIRNKTARLFEAAAEVGAVIAGGNEEMRQSMAAYGRHLGTAFQLVDDALDYSASTEELGKNIGDDLAEGKPTLPLLHALWHSEGEHAQRIRKAIEGGGLEDISFITGAIESTGGIEYTLALAREEASKATGNLALLPSGPYTDALYGLARFAVDRSS